MDQHGFIIPKIPWRFSVFYSGCTICLWQITEEMERGKKKFLLITYLLKKKSGIPLYCNSQHFATVCIFQIRIWKVQTIQMMTTWLCHLPLDSSQSSQSPFLHPVAHWAAPNSVSIALGHASANAVKATAGGWPTGSSASLTFPLHSHMSSARQEGSEYHL